MSRRRTLALALLALPLVGCSTWNSEPDHKRVVVVEGQPVPDMEHGDRLDIVPDSQDPATCARYGGTPALVAHTGLLICEDVDF